MSTYQPDSETSTTQESSNELASELVKSSGEVSLIDVAETVISSLDHENSAMVSQGDEGHLWKFKYGSVEVFVQLTGLTDDDTLTVWSSVLKLPVQNEAKMLRKLLEMNWKSTFEACFGILENHVVVLSTRTVAELSPGEISRAITVVASIADDNDDALQAEFPAA